MANYDSFIEFKPTRESVMARYVRFAYGALALSLVCASTLVLVEENALKHTPASVYTLR
jgi:hypothetical protein